MTQAQQIIYDSWIIEQTKETLEPYLFMPEAEFLTAVIEPLRQATKDEYDTLISGIQFDIATRNAALLDAQTKRQTLESP